MLFYLNRGFIAEQALVDIVRRYFHRLDVHSLYQNYHISITNDHPFAHLIIHQDSMNIADIFPSIVITTQSDSKVPDMTNMQVQTSAVKIDDSDIDDICINNRVKTIIDEKTGEETTVTKKDGSIVYEKIPGYCNVASDDVIKRLKDIAKTKSLYGISYATRKRDNISIEVWSENNQLKNEIYEHLRMFFSTSINKELKDKYESFQARIFDNSIDGQRSNNFNFDFDVALYGAHISLAIDYNVQQIVIDTDIVDINEIITEVKNNVKR